jgi:hypothetical protein
MSSSANGDLVVGVLFDEIAKIKEESRKLTRYNENTGEPYEVTYTQQAVYINGLLIPDVYEGCTWLECGSSLRNFWDRGTSPSSNIVNYLLAQGWEVPNNGYGDSAWSEQLLRVIGICAPVVDVKGDYYSKTYQIDQSDITSVLQLMRKNLKKIGCNLEPKLFLMAYI